MKIQKTHFAPGTSISLKISWLVTLYGVNCHVIFHSSLTIQSYAKSILTNRKTALICELGFDTERLINLISDWSVETMNPDMMLDGMSLFRC